MAENWIKDNSVAMCVKILGFSHGGSVDLTSDNLEEQIDKLFEDVKGLLREKGFIG